MKRKPLRINNVRVAGKISVGIGLDLDQRLRYIVPENLATDFPSKRERSAILAVFAWIEFNSICARSLKRGHYATYISQKEVKTGVFDDYQAVVIDKEALDRAEALLAPKKRTK